MSSAPEVRTLFLDIGGVILSNGWDRAARRRAAERFQLEAAEVDERHHLTFDTYETGKLTLEEYLDRVVFHRPRSFTHDDFRSFMLAQSEALPGMESYLRRLKAQFALKLVVVSNEGRELTEHRIRRFHLGEYIDAFVSSSFVHFRKPDADIYRIALDLAQTVAENVLYLDDRELFIEVARTLGIRGVVHQDLASTQMALASMGLALPEE